VAGERWRERHPIARVLLILLFLSIVPLLVLLHDLLHVIPTDLVVGAVGIVLMGLSAAASAGARRRQSDWRLRAKGTKIGDATLYPTGVSGVLDLDPRRLERAARAAEHDYWGEPPHRR
jgi:hypothetical protein